MTLVQVVPSGDQWAVLNDGQHEAAFQTQEEAAEAGRARARELGAEFQLQGQDGRIREKDSYGNDPRDVEG
jgi:hypothetical protein